MTPERAIEILTNEPFTRYSPSEYDDACTLAVAALKLAKYTDTGEVIVLQRNAKIKPWVRGTWEEKIVEDSDPMFRRRFYCSACGSWTSYGKTLYCPDCGADMRGDDNDE
ncbi:MAG: hypothetical protein J6S60_00155 [Oscillospiraceae bacterium]|nr:hypothetical protein [Oscillospiraceae bacterium]